MFFHNMFHRFGMPEKKRSREEFEAYLKAMLNQNYPKVKYSNPDAWRQRALRKNRQSY